MLDKYADTANLEGLEIPLTPFALCKNFTHLSRGKMRPVGRHQGVVRNAD
jgi:hypothetical protein